MKSTGRCLDTYARCAGCSMMLSISFFDDSTNMYTCPSCNSDVLLDRYSVTCTMIKDGLDKPAPICPYCHRPEDWGYHLVVCSVDRWVEEGRMLNKPFTPKKTSYTMSTFNDERKMVQKAELERLDLMIEKTDSQIRELINEGYPTEANKFTEVRRNLASLRKDML